MTRTVLPSLVPTGAAKDLLDRRCHRRARVWRLQRRDGQTFRLTDHDRSITFRGETYSPTGLLQTSASTKEKGLRPTSRNVAGYIVSTLVTFDDLRAHKWQDCVVVEHTLDWRFPFLGHLDRKWYEVSSVQWDGERFDVALTGVAARLEQQVGRRLSRTCTKDLLTCGADLTGLILTGVAVSTSSPDKRVNIYTTDYNNATLPNAQYQFGTVEFTTAASSLNTGERWPIKSITTSGLGVDIELQLPLPADIDNSDEFTWRPGCDKRFTGGCVTYDNRALFGGYPHLPGGDRANEVP